MRRVYAGLPSVHVEPLRFSADDISGERLLAMLKVDENTRMPLSPSITTTADIARVEMPPYMETIMSILRSMGSNFNYTLFREELKRREFNSGQKMMLNLRLSLLDSCLEGGSTDNRVSTHFRKGQLTIIERVITFSDAMWKADRLYSLSSPFMDSSSACGFFDLILGLFVQADVDGAGKIVVLDEAHKVRSRSSLRLS